MDETILITRPDHDDTTFYLCKWCDPIIEVINRIGKRLIDLKRKRANRKAFESVLRNKSPRILFLNGHGSKDTLCGHDDETILDFNNMHLLKSKITYSRSCKTAQVLGFQAAKQGYVKAFIGYTDDFTFPYDLRKTATPDRDKFCAPILNSSNMVMISLVKGKDPNKAYKISQETYENNIRHHMLSKEPEAPQIVKHLIWNKQNQVIYEN